MSCPVCTQDVPLTHAVEWDCEPAPGSGKWGMRVCATCHDGIYGIITPWDYALAILGRERQTQKNIGGVLRDLHRVVDDADSAGLIPR